MHSCKGDDDFINGNTYENSLGTCDVELGDFNLLESSLNSAPYNEKSSVYFENKLGEQKEFIISEKSNLNFDGLFFDYNVMSDGDTVAYCYTVQRKSFLITNEELNLEFEINIEARPYFADIEQMQSADVINIFYTDQNAEPARYVMIFRKTLDQRTYPVPLYTNNSIFETMDILGKSFKTVEVTNYNSPSLVLYYNPEVGIVSFENTALGAWRFSQFKE